MRQVQRFTALPPQARQDLLQAWDDYRWATGEQLLEQTPDDWCAFLSGWLTMGALQRSAGLQAGRAAAFQPAAGGRARLEALRMRRDRVNP